nr:MAG TPA: hypothetical protein [Caudoviricetes sp.]
MMRGRTGRASCVSSGPVSVVAVRCRPKRWRRR